MDGRSGLDAILDEMGKNNPSLIEEEGLSPNERETTTPRPTSSNTTGNENKARIRVVQGHSNVRTGPDEEFDIVGIAPNNEEYEVLETSPNQNWFKIELSTGEIGWIGSSRVTTVSP